MVKFIYMKFLSHHLLDDKFRYPWHAMITGGALLASSVIILFFLVHRFRETTIVQFLSNLELKTVGFGDGSGIVSIIFLSITVPLYIKLMQAYTKKFPHKKITNRGLSRNVSWVVVTIILTLLILVPAILIALYSNYIWINKI